MFKGRAGQKFLLTTVIHIKHYYEEIKRTSAVRSKISAKLIFSSCVGYSDRSYYGFYVTSSRMLVLIEGNKIRQLCNSVSVLIRIMWLWICMRPYLYWLDVILLTDVWGGGKWPCIMHYWVTLYHARTAILLSTAASHEPSDVLLTCTWAVGHSFNLSITK